MSVLSLCYQESNVTITNISQILPHIMAGKQLAQIWYEEITSLSPYVQYAYCSGMACYCVRLLHVTAGLAAAARDNLLQRRRITLL